MFSFWYSSEILYLLILSCIIKWRCLVLISVTVMLSQKRKKSRWHSAFSIFAHTVKQAGRETKVTYRAGIKDFKSIVN